MSLDDIPTGVPLTAREFFQAMAAGAALPTSPWEDEPNLVADPLHRLDADLQAVVALKREADARMKRLMVADQQYDVDHLDADSQYTLPDSYPVSYLRLGGKS